MDTTLAVNPGSASKKYALYRGEELVLTALFERTGDGYGKCVEVNSARKHCEDIAASAYEHALDEVMKVAKAEGAIINAEDISRVGVRIVAPGRYFLEHRIVDEAYLARLTDMRDAAPLHIPHELEELVAVRRLLPHAVVVGASDSAFHHTMPDHARIYSIPQADASAFDVHRFGYHGLSTGSVVKRLTGFIGTLPIRLIVCHIGSGVSVTAVKGGASIDTTMGFGPASGLMMNTRAGELDPAALLYLMRKKAMDVDTAERYVSRESGIKGCIGQSDLRIALEHRTRGDYDATVAVSKYITGIKKAIGAMGAVLGGIDGIVLTGTVSERNAIVREELLSGFEYVGAILDRELNDALMEKEGKISTSESKVAMYVVKTDEMREVARIGKSL